VNYENNLFHEVTCYKGELFKIYDVFPESKSVVQ